MTQVFLSYAREDENLAHTLWLCLRRAGLEVWYDKVNIEPGQDWRLEIGKAIREARVFLVCLSTRVLPC